MRFTLDEFSGSRRAGPEQREHYLTAGRAAASRMARAPHPRGAVRCVTSAEARTTYFFLQP